MDSGDPIEAFEVSGVEGEKVADAVYLKRGCKMGVVDLDAADIVLDQKTAPDVVDGWIFWDEGYLSFDLPENIVGLR